MTILAAGLTTLDFVFTVDHMPDRAEKYRANDLTVIGGGCAANAAVAISRLGGDASLATRLGQDGQADQVEADLISEGVDCRFVERVTGCRTSTSAILVDPAGNRLIVNHREDASGRGSEWIDDGDLRVDGVLADTRWPEGANAAIALATRHGVPAVLDAEAPVCPEAAESATHVVFSEQGLRCFTQIDDITAALTAADARLGGWVAVTVGPAGTLVSEDGRVTRIPAPEITAIDTLAAGDVWHGAFTLAIVEGFAECEAVRFANAAAALKCSVAGGRRGAPRRHQVEQLLQEEW